LLKTRVAVFVSGGGTNLQAIIDAQKNGIIKSGEVVRVISNNPNAYAVTRAKNAGIPVSVVTKKESGSQEALEERFIEILEQDRIDLIVLAGYMSIFTENFTSRYPKRIINVHPSLIPSFCGKGYYGIHVHEAALQYGVKVTGATVHFVNEIPDGGEIIMQKSVPVKKSDTPEELQKRVMEKAEWVILPRAVEQVSKDISISGGR
jgi:phosphoribosylglycinamide formyltransferase-1